MQRFKRPFKKTPPTRQGFDPDPTKAKGTTVASAPVPQNKLPLIPAYPSAATTLPSDSSSGPSQPQTVIQATHNPSAVVLQNSLSTYPICED